jgi:ketosteroid isomerase-like protein
MATELSGVVADHIAAINARDTDAVVATFAEDAYVNDNHREFVGTDAIRRWVAQELVGDKVSIEVGEVIHHHGDTIVRGAYDVPMTACSTKPTSPTKLCCRTTAASATTRSLDY